MGIIEANERWNAMWKDTPVPELTPEQRAQELRLASEWPYGTRVQVQGYGGPATVHGWNYSSDGEGRVFVRQDGIGGVGDYVRPSRLLRL